MKTKKKGNALIVSDLHLDEKNISSGDNGKFFLPILNIIIEKIRKHNPQYLFNLGDTFHSKDSVSATLLQIYREFLEEATKYTHVIQLVGNHDFSVVAGDFTYHAFRQYDRIPNLTIVDDYFRLDEENVFISYSRTSDLFEKRLKEVLPAKRLFAHLDVNGFKLGDSYIEQHVYLNHEDLLDFTHIISGHYHEPQSKELNGCLLEYVGSAQTEDFGESDQEKRFMLLDLDSGKSIDIPTERTMHKTLKIDATDTLPEIPAEDLKKGIKYRIIAKGTPEEIELLLNSKPSGYKVSIVPNFIKKETKRLDIKLEDNKDDIIEKYVQEVLKNSFGSIEDSPLDEKKLIDKGKRLWALARSKTK